MVFNATFNNISVLSWWSVLLVEESGVCRENHRPKSIFHMIIAMTVSPTNWGGGFTSCIEVYADLHWNGLTLFSFHIQVYDWILNFAVKYIKGWEGGFFSRLKIKVAVKWNLYYLRQILLDGWFMVFIATFNNISVLSWGSVLLVEEIRVPRENHWPVTSYWQS